MIKKGLAGVAARAELLMGENRMIITIKNQLRNVKVCSR